MTDRWQALVSTLRERFAPDADADEIAAFLASEGYDRRQIGEIVARFRAEILPPATGAGARPRVPRGVRTTRGAATVPVRVAGPHERGRFAPEAWGCLVALQTGGVLSMAELEQVIDRLLEQVEGRVALADVRSLLAAIGLADVESAIDSVIVH